jgi:hypothetical protein
LSGVPTTKPEKDSDAALGLADVVLSATAAEKAETAGHAPDPGRRPTGRDQHATGVHVSVTCVRLSPAVVFADFSSTRLSASVGAGEIVRSPAAGPALGRFDAQTVSNFTE